MTVLPLNEKKVAELIRQCRHLNVFPSFLNHYYPSTSDNPVSKLLNELIGEGVELLLVMSEDEIRSLVEDLPLAIRAFVDLRTKDNLDDFKLKRIAFQCIVALIHNNYLSFANVVKADLADSEVLKVY